VTSPCTESLGRNHAEEWSTTGQEAPGTGQPGGAGRAWVGQARPNRPGVWHARPGPGVAEVVARVEVMRERERERSGRKKGLTRVLYPLIVIGPTHQPMNISRLAYVAVMAPYVRRPTNEHKLRTSISKLMNVI
jgi:hypothetical protein